MSEPAKLKLRAIDAEDLHAISTVVQDALVPVGDMTYLPDEKRFVLAMNRFRWEVDADADGVYERTNSGLCFDNVIRVELRGFIQSQHDFILDLLNISYEAGQVILNFANFRDVRLTLDHTMITDPLECRLDDFGEPWPTKTCPHHARAEEWKEWAETISSSSG